MSIKEQLVEALQDEVDLLPNHEREHDFRFHVLLILESRSYGRLPNWMLELARERGITA